MQTLVEFWLNQNSYNEGHGELLLHAQVVRGRGLLLCTGGEGAGLVAMAFCEKGFEISSVRH